VDSDERVDDHRHLEHDPHPEDEGRHEGQIFGCAELVLDDLAAEIYEESDGVREEDEVTESHPEHEKEKDR